MVLYAASMGCGFSCYSSLYKSADEGGTWTHAGLDTGPPSALVVDTSSAVTVAAWSAVYRSADRGQSWTDFADGLLGNAVHAFAQSRNRLYAATDQGVFVATLPAPPPPPPTRFHTMTPCRLVDTREPSSPYGGPALVGGAVRSFTMGGQCSVPPTARSVSINATVTAASSAGYLVFFPGGTSAPFTSTLNFRSGQTRANNGIVPLGGGRILSVHNFDYNDPKDVAAIRLVASFESILMRLGVLPSDFTLIAAQEATGRSEDSGIRRPGVIAVERPIQDRAAAAPAPVGALLRGLPPGGPCVGSRDRLSSMGRGFAVAGRVGRIAASSRRRKSQPAGGGASQLPGAGRTTAHGPRCASSGRRCRGGRARTGRV